MDLDRYLSSKAWLVEEKGFDPARQHLRETQFTLGNGYLGMRGIYEEIPYDSIVGTFIAGVFDSSMSQVDELVNAPNPIDLKIMSDGEKLDLKGMKVRSHWRALNMRRAALLRKTTFVDRHNNRLEYRSVRFMSAADPHVGAMKVSLKAVDGPAKIAVLTVVDASVTNPGVLSEGRKRHLWVTAVDTGGDSHYLEVETLTSRIRIGYATRVMMRTGGRTKSCPDRMLTVRLEKGEMVEITKLFAVVTSNDVPSSRVRRAAADHMAGAAANGFDGCYDEHAAVWDRRWEDTDVRIKGESRAQHALRFNIYHLLISGNPDNEHVSIGARTLSGFGYRGHVFWDVELYMFPFYLFCWPEVARNLMRFRYHQLEQARHNARALGYRGALFGWETTVDGTDVTPQWFKALDYSITRVETSIEHHLMGDIAYAVNQYALAGGDDECLRSWGAEILFETARFWASRVTAKRGGVYDIDDVIGPDEFHVHVSNNAFTNYLARWNLNVAYWRYQHLKADDPAALQALVKKTGLSNKEVEGWLAVARGIPILTKGGGPIIEQFAGYFKKRPVKITEWDERFMPQFPQSLAVPDLNDTQLIKQADVLLLFHLFPEDFHPDTMRKNFRYYDRRTAHKSSLSHAIHTLAALQARYPVRAYQYFHYACTADLDDVHGNSQDGIHGGSLGATWQAVVCGFGGVRILREKLWLMPRLPLHWTSLEFKIRWRGALIAVSVEQQRIAVGFESAEGAETLEIGVHENMYQLRLGETLHLSAAAGGPFPEQQAIDAAELYERATDEPAPGAKAAEQ